MQKPMISVAGIRGTLAGSLIPQEYLKFAAAFAASLENKTVVMGTDTRPSREMVRHIVLAACQASGVRVLDLGIVPTPTVGLMAKRLGAGGGIAITASHNPVEWNALKFFSAEGTFLTREQMDHVLNRYENDNYAWCGPDALGTCETVDDPAGPHMQKVLDAIDVETTRKANFTVAIDLCNGAGGILLLPLLDALGCKVRTVFEDTTKPFERVAEPLPENLGALGETVRDSNAVIGFAVDPDADRLALVDETGTPIGEERTLTLVSRYLLARAKENGETITPIVANLSTTRALDDVAAEFGTTVTRTRIGEANVVEAIVSGKALIGGEGNGGVIYPTVHPGRDAATGIALMLEALATSSKTLSALNAEVPDYDMVKDKISIEGMAVDAVLTRLKTRFSDASGTDETDGLKIMWPDRWLHVRPSGTEPILRVFTEAPDARAARELADQAMQVVRG